METHISHDKSLASMNLRCRHCGGYICGCVQGPLGLGYLGHEAGTHSGVLVMDGWAGALLALLALQVPGRIQKKRELLIHFNPLHRSQSVSVTVLGSRLKSSGGKAKLHRHIHDAECHHPSCPSCSAVAPLLLLDSSWEFRCCLGALKLIQEALRWLERWLEMPG